MPLTVEVVEAPAAFEALREEWNAAAANVDPDVFLTWDWLATWWHHFGAPNPQAELHVVVVRDEAGVVRHDVTFMRGDHAYRRAWTNETRNLVTVTTTRPGRGGHLAGWRTRAARAAGGAVGGQRERGRRR